MFFSVKTKKRCAVSCYDLVNPKIQNQNSKIKNGFLATLAPTSWCQEWISAARTGKFFSKVKKSFVFSPTFEFSRKKLDPKFLENGKFQCISNLKHGFLTILNGKNFSFSKIWEGEMSILVKIAFSVLAGKFKCG